MKRFAPTILFLLAACGAPVAPDAGAGSHAGPRTDFGQLGPQGGTLTAIVTGAASGLTGGCTSGSCGLSLTLGCSNNQSLTWNAGGSSWGCASVAVNNANANTIPVSNGTNLNNSTLTDNGTTLSVNGGQLTITESNGNIATNGTATIHSQYTWINRQVCTTTCTGTGTTTYTPTTGTRGVIVTMCGAGGGGGGAAGVSSQDATGGGGASGALIQYRSGFANSTVSGGTWTPGTAGTAGASGNNNGGTGGDSTLVVNSATATAKGGVGGTGGAANATGGQAAGGTVQAGSTITAGSLDYVGGWQGMPGLFVTTSFANSGAGGSTPFGVGGAPRTGSAGNGNNATGQCAGGGGGLSTASNQSGGAGTAGAAYIDEYL